MKGRQYEAAMFSGRQIGHLERVEDYNISIYSATYPSDFRIMGCNMSSAIM